MCYDIEIGLRCAQAIATILGSMVNILQEGSLSILGKEIIIFPQVVPHVNLTLVETFCISRGKYISALVNMKLSAQCGNWEGYVCDHMREMSRIFSSPSLYDFCISTPIMMKLKMTNFVIRNYSLTG